jgi:hypothetical protein
MSSVCRRKLGQSLPTHLAVARAAPMAGHTASLWALSQSFCFRTFVATGYAPARVPLASSHSSHSIDRQGHPQRGRPTLGPPAVPSAPWSSARARCTARASPLAISCLASPTPAVGARGWGSSCGRPRNLVWGLGSQAVNSRHSFFFIPVSLFDLKARFFVPTRTIDKPARAGAVRAGRPSAATAGLALTASSTTARFL